MNGLAYSPEEERRKLELLIATVLVVSLPHALNLNMGIMLFFIVLIVWRFGAVLSKIQLPGRALLFLLTMAGAGLVFNEYHRFYGREAGASLFVVGLGLKLMEVKSPRDAYLVVFLGFLVALTQYLFDQSIPMLVYTLGVVVLLVITMICLNSVNYLSLKSMLRMASIMVAQAIPVMLVLFVLFPRINGPLWTLPSDEHSGKTGLSDTIEPGSISSLGLSQEPAFRVDFDGPVPPTAELYWRGPVFWQTDGKRWSLLQGKSEALQAPQKMVGTSYRYAVTLEPHYQHWVLALDLPSQFPPELTETAEHVLLAKEKITERKQFRLVSRPRSAETKLSEQERTLGLELPHSPSERTLHLVQRWTSASSDNQQIVDRALRYFRDEQFFYTLNPPKTADDDPVDSFLFETRRGFCEHYATSFVILMRAAGIPARVVTGYQGGHWNQIGHFLEVKQADAHAWAEVWLEGRGWIRIDPTGAVAPDRIERGLDLENQAEAGEIRFNLSDGALGQQAFQLRDYFRQMRMAWASVDHAWDKWVLSYGPENQSELLESMGIIDWQSLAIRLGSLLVALITLMAVIILYRRPPPTERAVRIYSDFLKKMKRRGITKGPAEGPLAFAERAMALLPEADSAIWKISALYADLRYGRAPRSDDLKNLQQLIRTLKI